MQRPRWYGIAICTSLPNCHHHHSILVISKYYYVIIKRRPARLVIGSERKHCRVTATRTIVASEVEVHKNKRDFSQASSQNHNEGLRRCSRRRLISPKQNKIKEPHGGLQSAVGVPLFCGLHAGSDGFVVLLSWAKGMMDATRSHGTVQSAVECIMEKNDGHWTS